MTLSPSLLPILNVNLPLLHGVLTRSHWHHAVHDERGNPPSEVVLRHRLLSYPPIFLFNRPCASDRDHNAYGAILIPRILLTFYGLLHELKHTFTYALVLRVDQLVAVGHYRDRQSVVRDLPVITFIHYCLANYSCAFRFITRVDFLLVVKVNTWATEFLEVCVFENKNRFANHVINFISPCLSFH